MMATDYEGPYVSLAAICQVVLREADGTLSLVRVVDGQVISTKDASAPATMPLLTVSLSLVVALVAGSARGEHLLTLLPRKPSGERLAPQSVRIAFEGDDSKAITQFMIGMQTTEEGLYWFDILLDDRLQTRIPYKLEYHRLSPTLQA